MIISVLNIVVNTCIYTDENYYGKHILGNIKAVGEERDNRHQYISEIRLQKQASLFEIYPQCTASTQHNGNRHDSNNASAKEV
jgi:hypothetical protein